MIAVTSAIKVSKSSSSSWEYHMFSSMASKILQIVPICRSCTPPKYKACGGVESSFASLLVGILLSCFFIHLCDCFFELQFCPKKFVRHSHLITVRSLPVGKKRGNVQMKALRPWIAALWCVSLDYRHMWTPGLITLCLQPCLLASWSWYTMGRRVYYDAGEWRRGLCSITR